MSQAYMQQLQAAQDAATEAQTGDFPAMPTFQSDLTGSGALNPEYAVQAEPALQFQSTMPAEEQELGSIPTLNTQPLNNLESFAQSGSNNPWVQAQMQAEQQEQGQAMGAAQAGASSANAAAEDQMAARGGLNTGAMENLARNAANNSTMAGEGVVGQGLQAQQAIQSQNAQNELGVEENLPGQEVQALQPALQEASLWQQADLQNQAQQQQLGEEQQQYQTGVSEYNTTNQLQGLNAQNTYNMDIYQNQIAQQAGAEEANAQANSGKK